MKSYFSIPAFGSSKAFLAWAVGVSLIAGGAGSAQALNILFNANLDQTAITSQINPCPVGWTVNTYKLLSGTFNDGGDSETFCNVQGPNGSGFFFKPFQGSAFSGDLLDVFLYQDNSAAANNLYTLSGYAACEANFCGLFDTNSPAPEALFFVEFLDGAGGILASNGYDLVAHGMPTTGPAGMALMTMPTVQAPTGSVTVRSGAILLNGYNPNANPQNYFVDAFDLETAGPPGSPGISNQPVQQSVVLGGTAHFSVVVSNTTGVSYQWQLNGANVSGPEFSGANSPTLTVTGVSASDVGHYRVLVSNTSGGNYSADAPLSLINLAINPVITITGKAGDNYRIDYTTDLNNPTWIPLVTNHLTSSMVQVVDPVNALANKRFYRSVNVP